MGHRKVGGLVAFAVAVGLQTAIWRPAIVAAAVPPPDSITTYAGGIGAGIATQLAQDPRSVAVFGTTVYVSDYQYSVVRALDTGTGQETVYAGGGTSLGDGGPATSARLTNPLGIAVDGAGNLFIADTQDNRVRRVDASAHIITTVATVVTPSDVALDSASDLFIAGANRILRVDHTTGNTTTFAGTGTCCYSGDGGPATSAHIVGISVAVDASNNVYIAEGNSFLSGEGSTDRVRVIAAGTGIISTYTGTGTPSFGGDTGAATAAGLNAPVGVRFDTGGRLLIADAGNGRIRAVAAGIINTIAGGGGGGDGSVATSALLYGPGLASVNASNDLFIVDNYKIRRVDHSTNLISTVAGTGGTTCGLAGDGGPALSAQLCIPSGMVFDAGDNLYFADKGKGRIKKITSGGVISTVAGGGAGCAEPCLATSAKLNSPSAVAVGSAGDLFIADTNDQMVKMVDHTTGNITTMAGTGVAGFTGDGGLATSAQLNYPNGIAVDSTGNVFIADTTNSRVREVDHATLHINTVAGTSMAGFSGDNGPGTSAQLNYPTSVAIDGSSHLYIGDNNNNRVRRLTAGTITTFAGGGSPPATSPIGDGLPATAAWLSSAQAVSVDGLGRVYVVDGGVHGRIRVVSGDGIISTLAGCYWSVDPNCPFHYVEGGPATQAYIGPSAVAVDSNSNAFIAGSGITAGSLLFRVQAPIAPAVPTAVVAQPGDSQMTISWTAGADNGNATHRYTVTPYVGGTPQTPINVDSVFPLPTSVTISGLTTGTAYRFTVTAINAFGPSPASAFSNIAIPAPGLPGGINTHAGYPGNGPATSLGQLPYSLAFTGTHLYVGDFANPVVRDVNVLSADPNYGHESVLAGNDSYGYSGDGGPAPLAAIQGAGASVFCGPGLTYFADTYNYVIRRLDGSNNITTVAGDGQPGYSGDGGPATSAHLSRVFGLACRTGGGLYVADSDNRAVRIIDGSGIISTWWYGFSFPTGVAETGGTDLASVSDSGVDNVVWKLSDLNACVEAGSAPPQFLCGQGSATSTPLSDPRGLAWLQVFPGAQGTLYVADRGNNRILSINPYNETVSTVAGGLGPGFSGDGGPAASAKLNQPSDLAIQMTVDGIAGNDRLFVADGANFRVRQINLWSTQTINTIAGNGTASLSGDGGPATSAQLGNPFAVAIDAAGNQYVADNQNAVIRKIDPTGVITTFAGNGIAGFGGDGGPATSAKLNDPRGVTVDSSGNVYISDAGNQRIRKVDHATGNISTIAGNGTAGYSGDSGPALAAKINLPRAVAVDASGNVFIADTENNRVRMVTAGGIISTFAGSGTAGFSGDGGLAISAQLNRPLGLAVDGAGNVYIGDSQNNRVRRVDHLTGVITTIAGNGVAGSAGDGRPAISGELHRPFGLAFDATGNLYIADELNQRIRLVDTQGTITTIVGTCGTIAGFSGDGGPASIAQVNFPFGVAVDAYGNLYIADVDSNRVRGVAAPINTRGASCQGSSGTPGSRDTTQSSTGTPGPRILDGNGSLRSSVRDQPVSSQAGMHLLRPGQAPVSQHSDQKPATAPGVSTGTSDTGTKAAPPPRLPGGPERPNSLPVRGVGQVPTRSNQDSIGRWWLAVLPIVLFALVWIRKRRTGRATLGSGERMSGSRRRG